MPRLKKAEQEKIDNEIVSIEIPRKTAERIKQLAEDEKRSVADFLELAIDNEHLWPDDVVVKIRSYHPYKETFATVRGNPDVLLSWIESQVRKFTEKAE